MTIIEDNPEVIKLGEAINNTVLVQDLPSFSHDAELLADYMRQIQSEEDVDKKELAFVGLMRATEERVRGVIARRVTDAHHLEEVVSETYSRVWQYAEKFEFRSTVNTWLFRIATNRAISYLQRDGRVKENETLTTFNDPTGNNEDLDAVGLNAINREALIDHNADKPVDVAINSEKSEFLVEALGKISRKNAEAVILREIVGMSHAEIAERLGIKETTSKVRAHRGIKQLKAILTEQDTIDLL